MSIARHLNLEVASLQRMNPSVWRVIELWIVTSSWLQDEDDDDDVL